MRGPLLALFATTLYVRADGLGATIARVHPRAAALVLVVLVVAAAIAGAGWMGARAALAAALTFTVLRWSMKSRIGGTTGDTAGALVEVTEVAVLVSIIPD